MCVFPRGANKNDRERMCVRVYVHVRACKRIKGVGGQREELKVVFECLPDLMSQAADKGCEGLYARVGMCVR